MIRTDNYRNFCLFLLLGFYCLPSFAQGKQPFGPTDAELMLLPPYCHARIKGDDNTKKMWGAQMGNDVFVHLHHYCFGINYMNRMMFTVDSKEKAFNARRAITNFDYVIQRWPPSYPLTIEAIKYKAQVQAQQR